MDTEDFLSRVSLFSLMKREDLSRIVQRTRKHRFSPGEIIINEGERDSRLFVIIKGEVIVVKNRGERGERRLKTMGAYSYFGEMSLIDDLLRSASVIAKDETELISLDKLNLMEEIEKYPRMAVELLQVLSRRIRTVEKTMLNTLGDLLPICAACKKIKNEKGEWIMIESYISDNSEAKFSHGLCPDCAEVLYEDLVKKEKSKQSG